MTPLRILAFLSLALSIGASAQALRPGASFSIEIRGGETRTFPIALHGGEFVHIDVLQEGADVEASLLDPAGNQAAFSDLPNQSDGPESIVAIASTSGTFTLRVLLGNPKAPAGSLGIRVVALRPATPADSARAEAEQHVRQAFLLERGAEPGALQRAIDRYSSAFAYFERQGDLYREALTLCSRGAAYGRAGDFRRALRDYEPALALFHGLKDGVLEASMATNIGGAYDILGDTAKASAYYRRAVDFFRSTHNRGKEALLLNNLGRLADAAADWQTAIDDYRVALDLFRQTGDLAREAIALENMGIAYVSLGDSATGRGFILQALAANRKLADKAAEARSLTNLGAAWVQEGDCGQAVPNFRAAFDLSMAAGDRRRQALSLRQLGVCQSLLHQTGEARDSLQRAVGLLHELGDRRYEGYSMRTLAGVLRESKAYPASLDYSSRALALAQAQDDPHEEAQVRIGIARLRLDSGDLPAALQQVETALALAERVRARVGAEQDRASYTARNEDAYDLYIHLLMRLHRERDAFEAAERARARSLLEILAQSGIRIQQGADPALLERLRLLNGQIGAKAARLTPLLGSNPPSPAAAALSDEIRALEVEYRQVELDIRKTGPHFASITQPQTLHLPAVQALLEPDTALLEYSLGEATSYLWVVTRDSFAYFTLPPRAEIDSAVRQAYTLLTARAESPRLETPDARERRIAAADAALPAAAAALSRILLAPAASLLKPRLIIAASGSLLELPFSVLPDPKDKSARPLIASRQVAGIPSASVLDALRREIEARPRAPENIAAFADPVFSKSDPRLSAAQESATPAGLSTSLRILQQVGQQVGQQSGGPSDSSAVPGLLIPRLPYTRHEIDRILAASPAHDASFTGFQASRAAALDPSLARYRFLHFATHGYLDSERPNLSAIVLSMVDEHGAAQDGFLRANEIYNLSLNADLVVLSACKTGLGKQIRGEGLMGLTRGFLYAGAARVVVSLWNVNDEATSELMGRFYEHMLKGGKPAAEALRLAQSELAQNPRWSSPYYWGAFIQQGEWR